MQGPGWYKLPLTRAVHVHKLHSLTPSPPRSPNPHKCMHKPHTTPCPRPLTFLPSFATVLRRESTSRRSASSFFMRLCTRLNAFIQRSMGASTSLSSFLPVSLLILASSSPLKSVPPIWERTEPTADWLEVTGTTLPPPVSSYTLGRGAERTTLVVLRKPAEA